ncbi:MAG: hypothetical protein GQ574_09095 [Crocinitomix sp.]|nr:hypothetical protein [Crocinitomix sp.]
MSNNKNLIMVTGAAARISQEVACIDKLRSEKGMRISQKDTILAGFSSGSVNLLALNSCFRDNAPLNWDTDYKANLLWTLTNDQIFKHGGLHLSLLNTDPFRDTLNGFLAKAGLSTFGDLPFESYVLTLSDHAHNTEWANNFESTNQGALIASDLFMASTAIPVIFPWQKIGDTNSSLRNFPKGHFSDGGTKGQFINFEDTIGAYVLENGPFESIDIISPMRESGTDAQAELEEGLKAIGIKEFVKDKLGNFAAGHSFGAFLTFLEAIQAWQAKNGPLAHSISVNIPELAKNFGILDFNVEQAEYNLVIDWIDANPNDFAVPLDEFVSRHQIA